MHLSSFLEPQDREGEARAGKTARHGVEWAELGGHHRGDGEERGTFQTNMCEVRTGISLCCVERC